MRVLVDPGIDRLRPYMESLVSWMVLLQTSDNLVGRPLLGQPRADGGIQFRALELALQRPLAAADDRLPLSGDRRVATVLLAVADEFAANRALRAAQPCGDRLPSMTGRPHLRYGFAFFHAKLCHRWDSFRMALVMLHHSISPSEFFSYTNSPFTCVSDWTVPFNAPSPMSRDIRLIDEKQNVSLCSPFNSH